MKRGPKNLAEKILKSHNAQIIESELHLYPDQILTQDATATPVFLQVEAMGLKEIKPFMVSYVDHNTLQTDYKNQDDHLFLESMARKLGIFFSKPGNGICHQVHLERFAAPGNILIGSDSHTPTAGGAGMLAIGTGGLDIAASMAGQPFIIPQPHIVGIRLTNKLSPWSSAKDVILYLLKITTVKGGVGKIYEYFGEGVGTLSVYERATICNMGAEMGLTTSLFPSDRRTKEFLRSFGREAQWTELLQDNDCSYDKVIDVNLANIEPLVACPHSPDNVVTVREVEGTELQQVAIGSCTNSSYKDMFIAANILKGKKVAENVSLVVTPGSHTILAKMCETGIISHFINAGARILETTCGPCNGIGQAPATGANSLRTHNRNYRGRCGNMNAQAYLASPETAAVSAIYGKITDPRRLGSYPAIPDESFTPNNSLLIRPSGPDEKIKVVKGPNIKPVPVAEPLTGDLVLEVALKLGDNITTDDILPGGSHMLALRSNVPDSIPFLFERVRPEFSQQLDVLSSSWLIVGGENFGQGSSREHAVMVPLAAGMKIVLAKSFARIYRKNLINFGIVPVTFASASDYDEIDEQETILCPDIQSSIATSHFLVRLKTTGREITVVCDLSPRELAVLQKGGLLSYVKTEQEN